MQPYEKIIECFESGKNVLVTGGAGTGKTFAMRQFLDWADARDINMARTAMTGMASLQFDLGETVHRCLGLGINNDAKDVRRVTQSYKFRNELKYDIQALDGLIIDEVSMLRSDLLELIDVVLRRVLRDEPFGGLPVIFSGDMLQLPPVVKPEESKKFKDRGPWPFQSLVWDSLELETVYLTEIKRQEDPGFAKLLNMVRAGAVSKNVHEKLLATVDNVFPEGVEPVKLASTNREVESINRFRLKQLDGEVNKYKAVVKGVDDRVIQKLVRDCPGVQDLELKKGAQVMVLINHPENEYVNGSMGEFVGVTSMETIDKGERVSRSMAEVRLFKTGRTVYLEKFSWKVEKKIGDDDTEVLASFRQYPIKLAYAITIHKSQGASLDYVHVDLERCFAEGMAYVALSRARTYEGLRVTGWNPSVVKCNKDAYDFYMDLKNKGEI